MVTDLMAIPSPDDIDELIADMMASPSETEGPRSPRREGEGATVEKLTTVMIEAAEQAVGRARRSAHVPFLAGHEKPQRIAPSAYD